MASIGIRSIRVPGRSALLRRSAAVAGAGAIVAMGAIGAVAAGVTGGAATMVSGGSMSTGETTTVSYSGTIAPVVAKPVVKATFFGES